MSAARSRRFHARLETGGEMDAWVVLPIPFDVASIFGTRGRVSVAGTLNGAPFRNSLFPAGDGTHQMMVNKALQAASGAGPNDEVEVEIARDDAPRVDEMPTDLGDAIARSPDAARTFAALSDSAKNEFIRWVTGAKRAETRRERVAKAVEKLAAGKRRVSG